MNITGTFLDEISHDIPHQNWGRKEWEKDFQAMKEIGIDTVILIRSGYKRWTTFPSKVLQAKENCYNPPLDLVGLYLELSEKYGMKFFFGLYDSGKYWFTQEWQKEVDLNMTVVDEVWARYGKSPAFKGWYLSQEICGGGGSVPLLYASMARHCKQISGNLPTLISPFMRGLKCIEQTSAEVADPSRAISSAQHEKEWNEIMDTIKGCVDIVAFQDGHIEYDQMAEFFAINKKLTDKYGMESWTNCETFDRDMPIKFLPIKWEKMLLKLEAAKKAGVKKAITFEFSHFMSPNSVYHAARHLYERYREHFKI